MAKNNFKVIDIKDGDVTNGQIVIDLTVGLTEDYNGWYYDAITKELSNCFIDAVQDISVCYPVIAASPKLKLEINNHCELIQALKETRSKLINAYGLFGGGIAMNEIFDFLNKQIEAAEKFNK